MQTHLHAPKGCTWQDMAFRRNLPVGCKPDGLLNNYNVEIVEHKLVNGKLTEIRIQK